jgi:hypothetical protein
MLSTGKNSLDVACWLARMVRSYRDMSLRYQASGDGQNPFNGISILAVCLVIAFDLDRMLNDLQPSTMAGNVMRDSVNR